ncbi:MAG: archease [Burkholderiaceae bacterium]
MRTGNSILNEAQALAAPRPGCWEHFRHDADIGIRGIALSMAQAFEQAALALTAVVTDLDKVRPETGIDIQCSATDKDILFLDWINALIFEMATRNMLFGRFRLSISGPVLSATAWGEQVDVARHHPAVEPKGATFTDLKVEQTETGLWIAQCVVDV